MEITEKIKGCYHECPFFGVGSEGMICGHPYFDNSTDPFDKMIITQNNSREGLIPEKCPLRKENLIINYELQK
jgi:hypothetical protein